MKKLLELRKKINKKRPSFERCDSYKRSEVSPSWRKPKGLQNKMRLQRHGKPAIVKEGYRNPRAVRGLDASGLVPVLVHNVAMLQGLDAKTQGVVIANVGNKKRVAIIEACGKAGLKVLNFKDAKATAEKIKASVADRKKKRSDQAKKKEDAAPKKKPKSEKKEEPKDESKSREEQKKEMEKVLTKRN